VPWLNDNEMRRKRRLPGPLGVIGQALQVWWDELFRLMLVNGLFLVCWLTIILGPPATFALYHVSHRSIEGYQPTLRDFQLGTKLFFGKSWLWALANLVVLSVLGSNILFYGAVNESWSLYVRLFVVFLILLWVTVQYYALSFMMIQETKSLRMAWKNSLLTILASPGNMLAIWAFGVLILVASVPAALPIMMGIIPFLAILATQAVVDRLQALSAMSGTGEQHSDLESSEHD